jgi:hypothetical protein
MRARQRHFKYRSIGPRAAYDARYISGLSDGAAVSSWSDLSGNGFTATQATTARQPVYKAAVLGGSASVRFDGAGDNLTHSITNNATHTSFVVLNRLSSQTGNRGIVSIGTTGGTGDMFIFIRSPTTDKWGYFPTNYAYANTTLGISSPCIISSNDNSTSGGDYFFGGNTDGTWTGQSGSQGVNHIGGYYTASPLVDQTSNIDVGALLITSATLSNSLRKLVQNGLAYSFKIACS